jgi:ferredoxin
MADKDDKYTENVAGSFYVDENCIACGICTSEASNNFKMSDDGSHAYVFKQPENEDEEDLCNNAMDSCPVDAIGNDG